MDTLRYNQYVQVDPSKKLEFQCIDWLATNEYVKKENPNPKSKFKFISKYKHVIKLFGITENGNSVCVHINDFNPYFYIKVNDDSNELSKSKIIASIKNSVDEKVSKDLISYEFVDKKEFYGFTNNKLFRFIKLVFNNSYSMNKIVRSIKSGIDVNGNKIFFKLYESNITPFIRYIHSKNVKACGWVTLEPYTYEVNDLKKTTCSIDVDIDQDDLVFKEKNEVSPLLIASFDIECSSSHGDFPLPSKNYKKLAFELYEIYKKNCKSKSFTSLPKDEKIDMFVNHIIDAFNHEGTDVSPVYVKEEEDLPDEYTIEKVSERLYNILIRQESYKIMALDLLRNYIVSKIKFIDANKKLYKEHLTSMVEDVFCNSSTAKQNKTMSSIYTKTNKKPSKYDIENASNKCNNIIFNNIKKILDDLKTEGINNEKSKDYLTDLVTKILYSYYICENMTTPEKIEKISKKFNLENKFTELLISKISLCVNSLYSILDEIFPDIDTSRDTYCKRLTEKMDWSFPPIEGDKVIQIGTTVRKFGEKDCFIKHIITLGTCSKIDNAIVEAYDNEKDVLLAWTRFIQKLDPDIITGYNIFGFDFSFMWNRAEELECVEEFSKLGRVNIIDKKNDTTKIKSSRLEIKKLASSALGDNILKYISMDGRIVMDLLKIVQKDFNLVSYKLDYVSEYFINDKIVSIDGNTLKVKGVDTLLKGNFITISYGKDNKYKNKKFKIKNIDGDVITLNDTIESSLLDKRPKWTLAKDDVSPQDIFRLQDGSADDRKTIAVYCIQDCELCNNLIDKLKIITNNIGMANVCLVPLSYLFLRGQGVKIFSLVSKECSEYNTLIPEIKCDSEEIDLRNMRNDDSGKSVEMFEYGEDVNYIPKDNDGGYEGAIVLKPQPGIYLEEPVTVLDYASLYPSSMISENLSHDSIILEDNDDTRKYMGENGVKELEKIGYNVVDVTHDVYKWINPKIKSKGKKKEGTKTCRFAQPKDGSKSIIPNILRKLLKARKDTRKKIKYVTVKYKLESGETKTYIGLIDKKDDNIICGNETVNEDNVVSIKDTYNDFEKSVYDGLQLAFKITANSLYGQIGARTSPIYLKDIAASTTATGRNLLYLAKDKTKEYFPDADIVYGDTDSIFINFNPKDENGKKLKNREALKKSIEMGVEVEEYIQQFLKLPHKLEYEKTFWPFILFSKKRYIGNKYEFKTGEKDFVQTSMGVVSKRRDNADIVKHIYTGVINILMEERNLDLSIKFLQGELEKLLAGKFGMDMLIITKSLRGYYKNPDQIAHKVLADRMGIRDPGNKPSSNDRIPYAYINVKGKVDKQGDRIEHPDFIRENNLKPDYLFYITNQIMKPVVQIYSLDVEKLKGFKYSDGYYEEKLKYLLQSKTEEKALKKIEELRSEDASDIVFGDILRKAQNKKSNSREITDFFSIK
jgi:DNA polymerase elongation subunit (family B)